jgi:hypothetical protein
LILYYGLLFDAIAQSSFRSKDAYLGQKPPGDQPDVCRKPVDENDTFPMDRVAFSKDGKEFIIRE